MFYTTRLGTVSNTFYWAKNCGTLPEARKRNTWHGQKLNIPIPQRR